MNTHLEQWAAMLQRPGSSWGFCALLKDTSVVVLKEDTPPPTIPARPEIRTHNLPLTSPTRYPLGHDCLYIAAWAAIGWWQCLKLYTPISSKSYLYIYTYKFWTMNLNLCFYGLISVYFSQTLFYKQFENESECCHSVNHYSKYIKFPSKVANLT